MKTLVLTIGILISLFSVQKLQAQGKRIPASAGREEYIEVEKNVRLHVTDLGEGQAIVLIHGWPLNNEMYEYQYQYLAEKGFRVIGISLRGFGKSDKPYGRYDFDVFSDDIKVVLEKLRIENAVLGGFSMGGAVVIHYVTKYKAAHVAKLALFAAAAPSWKEREDFPFGLPAEAVDALIKETTSNRQQLIASFGKGFAAAGTDLPEATVKWLENINSAASPYATTQSVKALRDLDQRADLGKITVPVAIFNGTTDQSCPFTFAEQLHKGIKNSYLVRFEKSGHALFVEEMDKFNTELEKFARK